MSAPPKFATLADAIAAYLAGRSRRWAEVDGHQVDLHAAAHPCAVSRADEERAPLIVSQWASTDREAHDYTVARNIAAELARASRPCAECHDPGCRRSTHLTLTDRETGEEYRATKCEEAALRREVLPELAVPEVAPVERCPWCGHVEEVKP